jgi:biotin carboxyl carrier protein
MKMEQTVRAPTRAKVSEVRVEAGRMVGPGAVLIVLEEIA